MVKFGELNSPTYEVMDVPGGRPVKMWTRGVPVEEAARHQLENTARLPIVFRHVAAMPDVHFGVGATVGSVIATRKAIIPAAVGVDIGCGMMAVQTSLTASQLPDSLAELRVRIERAVPHGFETLPGFSRQGEWITPPQSVVARWRSLAGGLERIRERNPEIRARNPLDQLGTLGGGNHFVELCLDEQDFVWIMLHSGSRGIGNRIGQVFIRLAREDMRRHSINLPDKDLAYLEEGTEHFEEYVEAMTWAQRYAYENRLAMMENILAAMRDVLAPFTAAAVAVNCHHNYVARERHFGEDVWLTRKGAVRAGKGELGIIPGSMGAHSYIVRGLGNPESFESCSHGAGRRMSRGEARRRFTVAEHRQATAGVECRKDAKVIDETPAAYKDIDAVMAAQRDLVEVVHTLKQVLCVKG